MQKPANGATSWSSYTGADIKESKSAHGRVSLHTCADCGAPAEEPRNGLRGCQNCSRHTQQSFPGKKCGTGDHHADHRMPGLQRPTLAHNGDLGGKKGDIKARGELLVIQNKEKGRGGKMNGDNGEVNMIQACMFFTCTEMSGKAITLCNW